MSPNTSSSGIAAPNDWLCAYVYTHEPLTEVLVRDVAPFVREVRRSGLAERFFFIRYWENGAHLRLRFHGNPAILDAVVLPEIARRFERHRVAYVPYEPETDRYGGADAIRIAEDCFDLSSRVALEILGQTDADGARGAAMLLHTALAHVFGMTRAEASLFFEGVARSRLRPGEHRFFDGLTPPAAPLAVWNAMENGDELDVPWLAPWISGLRDVEQRLRHVAVRSAFPLGEEFLQFVPARFAERWILLSSHVHMTNNRLGVTALDEPHIALLLSRGLAS